MADGFSIREFLRSRRAVLVHFSTVMARRQDLVFPRDLLNAMTLRGVPLAFSTVQIGDTGPHEGKGGAEGSVGLLVDVGPETRVLSVAPGDSGSFYAENTDQGGSLGREPTPENCAGSIDERAPSNEWVVQDYRPLGIYILPPIRVRQLGTVGSETVAGEVDITLEKAIEPFPNLPVYGANDQTFFRYDREARRWTPIDYDQIIPPDPAPRTE